MNIIPLLVSSLQRRYTLFIVSGAGVGYSPYFPGTKGTLLAIPISIGFNGIAAHAPLSFGLLLAVLTVGAISLSTTAAELLKQKDPQMIVIDEVIGFYDRQLSRAGSMGVVNPRFLAFPLLRYRESFPRYAFGKAARRHGHTAR